MNEPGNNKVRFADCYVLVHQRTREFITAFLDHFLPEREEYADTYEFPQFAEHPAIEFTSAGQLMDYLEHDLHSIHAIYWYHPGEAPLRAAMCLYTSDGGAILGLTCKRASEDAHIERGYLGEAMAFCHSTVGLVEYEKSAPKDTSELLQRIAAQGA